LEGVPQTATFTSAMQTTFNIKDETNANNILFLLGIWTAKERQCTQGKNFLLTALQSHICTALHCMDTDIQHTRNTTKNQKRNYENLHYLQHVFFVYFMN